VAWLQKLTSTRDISVKILATSHEHLNWQNEQEIFLNGLIGVDIRNGCQLFYDNLSTTVKGNMMNSSDNVEQLLQELVTHMDGHPLSLILLSHAAN
jgi:hypothetical protein